jgi:hypothetical protein
MMTQLQVIRLIRREMPVVAEREGIKMMPARCNSIHASIHLLSECTAGALSHRHFSMAQKCFALAERLYLEGDAMVRLLIENVFIYANVSMKNQTGRNRYLFENLIPDVFHQIHLRQLMGSGC